jgi:CheY-like chemotaxis protein
VAEGRIRITPSADVNEGAFSDLRAAVLVGFPKGLGDALAVVLGSRHFCVLKTPSAGKAIELLQNLWVDLVIASSRCSASSVVELTESLGQPRQTRVIVLLAGHDPEVERRYRNAGLQYVWTMPVTAEDLLRAAVRSKPPNATASAAVNPTVTTSSTGLAAGSSRAVMSAAIAPIAATSKV